MFIAPDAFKVLHQFHELELPGQVERGEPSAFSAEMSAPDSTRNFTSSILREENGSMQGGRLQIRNPGVELRACLHKSPDIVQIIAHGRPCQRGIEMGILVHIGSVFDKEARHGNPAFSGADRQRHHERSSVEIVSGVRVRSLLEQTLGDLCVPLLTA